VTEDLAQARIIPVRQEQLKERLGERFRALDTPLLVEWPDGKREALLFVMEEQTRNDLFSIHRLAHYCLDLSEMLKIERVVPVVIFLHPGSRPMELQLGGNRHTYLTFRYLLCDLKKLAAADYQDSDNLVARLNLPNMQYPPQQRLAMYWAAQVGLAQLEADPNKIHKYSEFIDYYADLSEQEVIEYQEHYQTKEGDIMGMVNIWKNQGLEQGIEQGIEQGLEKGLEQGEQIGKKKECIALLTRQLRRKFGLQPELEAALQQMPEMELERLEDLADALLDFKAISDLQAWLNSDNPHQPI
jgi:hypothetical protein